ncbi:MAG: hypothetical protein AAGA44_07855 [Pseudomonadota bacterium]
MAVNTKGSRRIEVEGTEFRWRATGNDGWISIVVWPTENDRTRLVGSIGYHQEAKRVADGHYTLHNQIVVTNRLIRRLILHFGVTPLLEASRQIDAGKLEDIIDFDDAVRAER